MEILVCLLYIYTVDNVYITKHRTFKKCIHLNFWFTSKKKICTLKFTSTTIWDTLWCFFHKLCYFQRSHTRVVQQSLWSHRFKVRCSSERLLSSRNKLWRSGDQSLTTPFLTLTLHQCGRFTWVYMYLPKTLAWIQYFKDFPTGSTSETADLWN